MAQRAPSCSARSAISCAGPMRERRSESAAALQAIGELSPVQASALAALMEAAG